ncbi:unnamed protein product [Ambrosiozyma monospora]|uniref:Unnamed protein product n=1 Tax=Ambrosiozyma monospora TaxID=43982 RepID=A0ACB5TK30_AMBMO|nr:unnamed protein product [Ambrosiozyma monospora]
MGCLIARTWLTLLVTKLDGEIMKDLIGLRGKSFLRDLIYWFLIAVPASYINSGIKYLTSKLALNFRTNLVRYCHDLYMDSRLVYYKLQFNNNDDQDGSEEYQLDFKYIDQNFTEDINKFATSLTSLFSNVGKPLVDLIFFAVYLRDNIGTFGIVGILINYFLTGLILRRNSPNFSKLWKVKTYLEGIYYNYNLNLINNCEEISFYKGIKFEKLKITRLFRNLISHIEHETVLRFNYQLLEEYILKFTWPAFGYFFAAIPIIFDGGSGIDMDSTTNMRSFIVNKRLILSMADAGSRLMFSIKDVSRLGGVTDTIFSLLVNLHQVHDSNFQYGLKANATGFGSSLRLNSFASKSKLQQNQLLLLNNGITGTIQKSYQGLRFEDIPVIIPSSEGANGEHLVNHLSFQIKKGESLLILGQNAVGKTSIIRLISELWPLYSGLLSKPNSNDIYYVSQKSYFVGNGSFRDQIIYPLNHMEMLVKGSTDRDLCEILNDVGLGYLLERFGSLDYNPAFGGGSTNVSNKTDETSNGAVLANGSAGSSISNETNGKGIVIDEVMVNGEIVKEKDKN